MADNLLAQDLESVLQRAIMGAEALKARIEAGEEIAEHELENIAKLIATQMEQARTMLETVVGGVDHEALKANLKAKLSTEEFESWLAAEEERLKTRASQEPA